MKGTTMGTNPKPLFEDGPGPDLDPVGGEFQPRLEIGYPGFGAHLIFVLKRMDLTIEGYQRIPLIGSKQSCQLACISSIKPLAPRLSRMFL